MKLSLYEVLKAKRTDKNVYLNPWDEIDEKFSNYDFIDMTTFGNTIVTVLLILSAVYTVYRLRKLTLIVLMIITGEVQWS